MGSKPIVVAIFFYYIMIVTIGAPIVVGIFFYYFMIVTIGAHVDR